VHAPILKQKDKKCQVVIWQNCRLNGYFTTLQAELIYTTDNWGL